MCLLRDKLESIVAESTTSREMVEPVKMLLKTSYDSAKASIHILELLRAQDLLGQCEINPPCVSIASAVLTMFRNVPPI